MRIRKAWPFIFGLILACVVVLPAAQAGTEDQATKFVFSGPVEIPGRVLPAGTYWFVLQPNDSDRQIVQVFSQDWSKVYATVLAIPTYRPEPKGETELKFAERPHQKPEALLKWYYPGLTTGHEFLYSQKHEREFAGDVKRDVLAEPNTLASNASVMAQP